MSEQQPEPAAADTTPLLDTEEHRAGLRDRRVLLGLLAVVAVLLVGAGVVLVPRLTGHSSPSAAARPPAPTPSHAVPATNTHKKTGKHKRTGGAVPPLYTGTVGHNPFIPLVVATASAPASTSPSTSPQPSSSPAPSTSTSTGSGSGSGTGGSGSGGGSQAKSYTSAGYLAVSYNRDEASCPAMVYVEVSGGGTTPLAHATLGTPIYHKGTGTAAGTSTCIWVYKVTFARGYSSYTFAAGAASTKVSYGAEKTVSAAHSHPTGPDMVAVVKF